MVQGGVVLGHCVSKEGLEVDREKIYIIETLAPSTNVKGVRSFLGHLGFYRRFIKVFSNVVRPTCKLLDKDVTFLFDEACLDAFEEIKKKHFSHLIMTIRNWDLPFKIMYDASDYAIGAVLR